MPRILHTGLFPSFPEQIPDDVLVITFQRQTAIKFGVANYSLTRLASAAIRRQGLTVASAALSRHTLRSVIAREYPESDPASLAARFQNTLEIVLRTGIDTNELIKHGSSRVRMLGIIASAHRSALRETGHIDKAELLWEAARCEPEPLPLLIFGHHRARKEEVLFINSVAGDGSTYFLPVSDHGIFTANREWAYYLAENGWTREPGPDEIPSSAGAAIAKEFISSNPTAPAQRAVSYPSIEAEVRGVLSNIKELITAGENVGSIALVARDLEEYIRPIAAVADEYGLPIRSSYAVPLSSTAFGGFVRSLLEAIDSEFKFEPTARLVKHPFGPGVPTDSFASARKLHLSGYEKWKELCPDLYAIDWTGPASLQEWVDRLRNAFEIIGVKRRSGRIAREILAYNRFFEALSARERLEGSKQVSFKSFVAAISEALADESVRLLPGNAGVEILTPKEVVGRSYEQLFVVGLAEGIYPQPAAEDPVADFFERRKLTSAGIMFASAAEVARWEDLSFFFTLAAAESEIRLSLAKMTGRGEAFPSSYLKRIGIRETTDATRSPVVSSIEERRASHLRHAVTITDDVIEYARRQYSVEADRESSSPYSEFDGVIGVPHDVSQRRWSASQLTAIGQCSFKWFAQKVLRLKPLEEMEYGLDPATRGLLYHKTLEIAVTRAKDEPDIRAAVLNFLEEAFADAEIDESVGLPVLPNWEQERLEQLRELRKAVAAPDFIFDGSRVVGIEQVFEDTWQGFPLIGYIDRIDNTPDGLIAIDYKTSGSVPKGAKDPNGKLTVDVQIPLYANVALKKLYPDGKFGNSVYYSLTKGKILRENKPDDMGKLQRLAEGIKEILAKGSFAIDPDEAGLACTYCDYATLCRKGPRLRRKART